MNSLQLGCSNALHHGSIALTAPEYSEEPFVLPGHEILASLDQGNAHQQKTPGRAPALVSSSFKLNQAQEGMAL